MGNRKFEDRPNAFKVVYKPETAAEQLATAPVTMIVSRNRKRVNELLEPLRHEERHDYHEAIEESESVDSLDVPVGFYAKQFPSTDMFVSI